jgi:hypothetical protein
LQQDENIDEKVGLEFFMRSKFIERACDFILGKKSPLVAPNEKRIEMGGSFSSPNFSPLIRLITKIISNNDLL